ncbi:LysR family transcriptional regulator [uncultured Pseudokineococcus sp.]|uniref:LysR family transcriptional regulator n=1 Tax=uncultured Pseudokineococcus sp. TaxID=1642928 RepID=UPI0026241C91|nr:LysR family transcriptional regulator [uncultured Pseudokineococcus sp.]
MNDLGVDLELRLVRYFTVLAEHLSFAAAADELHLAQPSLSRQIQRLEQRLGVRLLERTPRGNHLTDAGKAFLPEARALLRSAHRAAQAARAHSSPGRITIGYVDDLIVTTAVRELRARRPDAVVETRHLTCSALSSFEDGRVDLLVARTPLPFPTGEVWTKVLYQEARLLVVPTGHPLAGRASVAVGELTDETPYACAVAEGLPADGWTAYRLLGRAPLDLDETPGSYEDRLELVASGRAIGIQPAGDRRTLLHPGVTTVPLEGAPDSDVVLAGRVSDRNPLVEAFSEIAATHVAGPVRPEVRR